MHYRHGRKEQPAACRLEKTPGGCDLIKKQTNAEFGGGGGTNPENHHLPCVQGKRCSTIVDHPPEGLLALHLTVTGPGGGGGTTTGPDATPPPAICQNLGGGAVGEGGGVLAAWRGGGGLHPTHYYRLHTSRGCLGAWGYRGMYAIIAISCFCQEESLKGLRD